MSEQKSKYVPGTVYTQQFDSALPDGWGDVSEEATPIPSSLPTLLAQMVNEYDAELCKCDMFGDYVSSRLQLVNHFNTILLSAAQPTLAKYFDQLANPPMVVNNLSEEALQRAINDLPAGDGDISWQAREMEAWGKLNEKIEHPEGFRGNVHSARKPE